MNGSIMQLGERMSWKGQDPLIYRPGYAFCDIIGIVIVSFKVLAMEQKR